MEHDDPFNNALDQLASTADKRKMIAVPDILANSGGDLVSNFEWVQNLNRDHWTEEDVNSRLENKMKKAFKDVLAFSQKHNGDLGKRPLSLR